MFDDKKKCFSVLGEQLKLQKKLTDVQKQKYNHNSLHWCTVNSIYIITFISTLSSDSTTIKKYMERVLRKSNMRKLNFIHSSKSEYNIM